MAASVAADVRAAVAAAPMGAFVRSADLPGTRAGVHTALSRLSAAGEIVRVRHGLYWKGVKSRFGPGHPGLLDAAIAAAGTTGAGPSGWSATHALGLSTQIPATPEVAVAGPVPRFAGVKFHRRNNLARHALNVWEIALLEALRSYPAYAETSMDQLAARVRDLIVGQKIRPDHLMKAARREHSPALRANLASLTASLPMTTLTPPSRPLAGI